MNIVLASASPRREELMKKTGLAFIIDPADIDERAVEEKSAKKLAVKLAIKKAEAVASRHPNSIIIGSDLVVAYKDRQFGKPENTQDAKDMLLLLRGKTHQMFTAVAVINTKNAKIATAVEEASITMRNYSDQEIDEYIATGEPVDKAAAYAVQGIGRKLIERFTGNMEAIIGLPTKNVLRLISEVK